MSARRSASLLESFNYALEGIIHVLRTHRNMRFHFVAAVIVLVAAVWIGVDEETDALAFPIDGRDELPAGIPRQLGDVVLCPQVVGEAWRGPLEHAVLHLVGYEHGAEMDAREREHA